MRLRRTACLLAAMTIAGAGRAEPLIGEQSVLAFATADKAKALLASRDDFVERMSAFDRAARLKTDRDVSEQEYLDFVAEHVRDWSEAEQTKVLRALEGVREPLAALRLPLPPTVLVAKTTGREEGGAAYTRANVIVFPEGVLRGPPAVLRKTLCHEIFHVLSRANPVLREELYNSIGFVKCDEPALPPPLGRRKITNPDAPRNDHCLRVTVDGKQQWAVPVLFSNSDAYDPKRGGEFFHYLQFRLLLVDFDEQTGRVSPLVEGPRRGLVDARQVSGFFDQVGRNTSYIIHPEEILADNFALLVTGEEELPTPAVVDRMREILKAAPKRGPGHTEPR